MIPTTVLLLLVLLSQNNGLTETTNVNKVSLCQVCSNGSKVINPNPGWASLTQDGEDYCSMVDIHQGEEDCHKWEMKWPALCESSDPVCAVGVSHGGKCYSSTVKRVTWYHAEEECKKLDMSVGSVCYYEQRLYKVMKNLYKQYMNESLDKFWTNGGTTVCIGSSPSPRSPNLALGLSLGLGLPAGLILVALIWCCYIKILNENGLARMNLKDVGNGLLPIEKI